MRLPLASLALALLPLSAAHAQNPTARLRAQTDKSAFPTQAPLALGAPCAPDPTPNLCIPLDASFTLDGVLSGFAFDYAGTHTVEIASANVFDDASVDLTVTIDGELTVLDQTLSGVFVLKKTATETIIEGSNITVDLEVAGQRVLLAENGTGKFLVLDDELAGTASVTITAGPDLPNIDISGIA